MYITHINLKNFRCLSPFDTEIQASTILITGPNGAGKTTILEALHYACYLRSFRTHLPRELIATNASSSIINIVFKSSIDDQPIYHDLHIGFDRTKKLVKIDGRAIQTYKDLLEYYRIISITTDDMNLITGSPQERRTFIDQAISLNDPDYVTELRTFRTLIQNKNALLRNSYIDESMYHLWNEQIWQKTNCIQIYRQTVLQRLQEKTEELLSAFFGTAVSVTMKYNARLVNNEPSYDAFIKNNSQLMHKERIMGRSLFGAHVDDISLSFDNKQSKIYASRGQQKLTVFMLKVALACLVMEKKGKIILLLDDFMSDFDPSVLNRLFDLLSHLQCQLIFTSPTNQGYFEQKLLQAGAQELLLTNRKQ